VKKLQDTKHVDQAELRIPLDEIDMTITPARYQEALAVIGMVRRKALAHLEVTEGDADVTAVECTFDGACAVVNVLQADL
jgi:hypothetical protein